MSDEQKITTYITRRGAERITREVHSESKQRILKLLDELMIRDAPGLLPDEREAFRLHRDRIWRFMKVPFKELKL